MAPLKGCPDTKIEFVSVVAFFQVRSGVAVIAGQQRSPSAAKAEIENTPLIAAVNRCATRNQALATRENLPATNKLVDVFVGHTSDRLDDPGEERLARSKSATLTEAELRIMNVLWERGSATVHEVLQALPNKPALAYNSVLTIVRILEAKGYVRNEKDKRTHVYLPKIGRKDATRYEVRHLLSRFFGNSRELLVLNILEEETVDADELGRLRGMLDRSKKEER